MRWWLHWRVKLKNPTTAVVFLVPLCTMATSCLYSAADVSHASARSTLWPVHTTRVHGTCSRAVNTGVQNDARVRGREHGS